MKVKIKPMQIDEAKAELLKEFPVFDWRNCNVAQSGNVIHLSKELGDIKMEVHFVPGLGYKIQLTSPENGFFMQSEPEGEYSPTLSTAIAGLHQASDDYTSVLLMIHKPLDPFLF